MSLPRVFLRHTVRAEAPLGESYAGASYAEAVDVPCWHDTRRGVTGEGGATVTSSGTVFADLEYAEALAAGARITLADGHVTYVDALEVHNTGGLVPLDHVEATLK